MQPTIRFLTRADDAGGCESANTAIHECVARGVCRNVSLMANGAAIRQAAELLRDAKGVAFGCHLTLNAEWDKVRWGPVLPPERVPSLIEPDGTLTRTPMVLHERKANVEEMVAEARAQLDLLRKLGFAISYIDEHMGVGWQNGLRERLVRLAEDEGILHESWATFDRLPDADGGATDSADPVERLLRRLKAAPPGTYIHVTHPGRDAPDMRAFGAGDMPAGAVARERDADRRLFTDPRLVALCRGTIDLVRYPDVAARPGRAEEA